jgi:tetratricopeptide (TPR) repeat protein
VPSVLCLAALLAIAIATECRAAAPPGPAPASASLADGYLGTDKCRSCHEREFAAWKDSDHDLAMQHASPTTVLGDFRDASLTADGLTSTFYSDGDRRIVRTQGADGRLADFEVKYTFGVRPLQQYLVELPGGRLQALRQAWDSRPKEQGGQRWFHLYAGETIAVGDQLHWTGRFQNWNLACASCHSTNLRKSYDAATDTYATTWTEIDVACENCHGPGAAHVAWAAAAKAPDSAATSIAAPPSDPAIGAKGFRRSLTAVEAERWRFATPDARFASQGEGAQAAAESRTARNNVCAPCHARRSELTGKTEPGAPLEDSHRLALLTEPLYFADGQQNDEVFTWGSFLQSRMHALGVTCSDCHDSHSLETKAEGNALCSQCHNAAAFDVKTHHFHEAGSKGAACVECHMPARDYMEIDSRRDHSLRVPRPDLSAALAAPDACTSCHVGRTPEWAAGAMDGWYGPAWRQRKHAGPVLRAPLRDGGKSLPSLLDLAADAAVPGIVRATAVSLAAPYAGGESMPRLESLLADEDALVRLAALPVLERAPAGARVAAAAPLLSDSRRAVRMEAALVMADVPDEALAPGQRAARAGARRELLDSLAENADWPSAVANRGNLEARERRLDDAIASFEQVLRLDPRFEGAYVNLADAKRVQGRDEEGAEVLRRGLAILPNGGGLHHALGLVLVRTGDKRAGLAELEKAATLDPGNARYAFVYAVALHSLGEAGKALDVLSAADGRHPYDRDILGALVSMSIEAGRPEAVSQYSQRLAELEAVR